MTRNRCERIPAFYSEVLKVDLQGKAPTRLIVFSKVKEYTHSNRLVSRATSGPTPPRGLFVDAGVAGWDVLWRVSCIGPKSRSRTMASPERSSS